MTLALLFPGQGVAHAAMLPWVDAHPLSASMVAALADTLGADWRARCEADPAWRTQNRVAQPLGVGLALAAWAALAPRLPAPSVVAGYSVGEVAAYAASGVFDGPAALALTVQRARLMDASGAADPGGLCAVAGPSVAEVEAIVAPLGVAVAIRNAPDRCVIGGPTAALDAALALLAARGAEPTRLPIAVASHTPAMGAAARGLAQWLEPLPWRRAAALVVTGVPARATREALALKEALAAQVAAPIDWMGCLEQIAERQPRAVLEVGAGRSLAQMWTARFPEVPARSADEFGDADAVAVWVAKACRPDA